MALHAHQTAHVGARDPYSSGCRIAVVAHTESSPAAGFKITDDVSVSNAVTFRYGSGNHHLATVHGAATFAAEVHRNIADCRQVPIPASMAHLGVGKPSLDGRSILVSASVTGGPNRRASVTLDVATAAETSQILSRRSIA